MRLLNQSFKFFTLLFLLTSCVSSRYFDIQVLKPSTIVIPPSITTIYIVDNDSFKSNLYSAVFKSFHQNFVQRFKESPFYENKKVVIATQKEIKDTLIIKSLRKSSIAIIKPKIGLKIEKISSGYLLFSYRYLISITNADTSKIIDTCDIVDKAYFPVYNDSANFDSVALTICNTIGELIAENYAMRCIPYWVSEERKMFYSPNKYLKKGYQQFTDNNLTEALSTWEKLYQIGTPKLAAISAYNIALCYEIQDDLFNSEIWLKKSLDIMEIYNSKKYYEIIKSRLELRNTLDKQFN